MGGLPCGFSGTMGAFGGTLVSGFGCGFGAGSMTAGGTPFGLSGTVGASLGTWVIGGLADR